MNAAHATPQPETVGQRLRRRRNELGLTLDGVAARLGTNRQQVIRWEKDENEPTGYAQALADLYDLPIDEVRRPAGVQVEPMDERVRRLEAEVATLRKQLRRLNARRSGED